MPRRLTGAARSQSQKGAMWTPPGKIGPRRESTIVPARHSLEQHFYQSFHFTAKEGVKVVGSRRKGVVCSR